MAPGEVAGKEPSAFTTIFSVWNTMIGSSMLSLTWAFGNSGLVGGVVVVLVMLLITWYSIRMIMSRRDKELFPRAGCTCACHTGDARAPMNGDTPADAAAADAEERAPAVSISSVASERSLPASETTALLATPHDAERPCCACWRPERFTDFMYVCRDYLGEPGRWAAWTGSVITLVGAALVYDILLTTNLYSLVHGIYDLATGRTPAGDASASSFSSSLSSSLLSASSSAVSSSSSLVPTDGGGWFESFWSRSLVPVYFMVLFLPLCCFPRLQSYVRISSFGIVGMLYVVLFIVVSAATHWVPATHPRHYGFRPHATYLAGIMCLAFFVHNFVLQVSALTSRPRAALRNVTVGFSLGGLSYAFLGAFTYAALGDGVPQDYFDYFAHTNVFAMTGKFALLFQLCTVLPFLMALLRTQLFAALFGADVAAAPPLGYTLLFNVVLLGVATLLSIFYPYVGDVLRFTGPICAVIYVFLLPALVTLAHLRRHNRLTRLMVVLHVLYVCIGVTILVFQFV